MCTLSNENLIFSHETIDCTQGHFLKLSGWIPLARSACKRPRIEFSLKDVQDDPAVFLSFICPVILLYPMLGLSY